MNSLFGDVLEKQGHSVPSCGQAWQENEGGRGRRNPSLRDASLEMGALDSFKKKASKCEESLLSIPKNFKVSRYFDEANLSWVISVSCFIT